MIFQGESGDMDTEPPYLCDAERDDETIGKALSSPLFIQEREEPADRRQAYHSHEESLLSAQSFFAHARTGRFVHELSSCQRRKSSPEVENERIRFLLERQKKQILSEVRTEIQKHEFQADSDGRSIQELNGIIESQQREIDHTAAGDEQLRRDQLLLREQLSERNRDLREAHFKSLYEMEELKRVQESRVDESSRRRLIENQDTISEVTARIQELQNEVNCLNNSRDFKDAESVRSGLSHVLSQPTLVSPFRGPGGMPSRPGGLLSRNDKPPDIWEASLNAAAVSTFKRAWRGHPGTKQEYLLKSVGKRILLQDNAAFSRCLRHPKEGPGSSIPFPGKRCEHAHDQSARTPAPTQ